MPSIRYAAPAGTEVSSTVPGTGEEVRISFSKDGFYTATKAEEIAALDAVAELEAHPITFAPTKEK